MKHKGHFIAVTMICLALIFGLFAAQAQAAAYGLQLQTKDGSGATKTDFVRGEKLYLHIIATELQAVAGCAFTLNYDAAVLTAPVTDAEGVAPGVTITSQFPFTFVKAGHADNNAVTMRENSTTTPGKILFSGASIDTATGGGKFSASTSGASFPLFVVEFTVKNTAQVGAGYGFSLAQTVLNNTAAGYAAEGEGVPVLVGANAKGDGTGAAWTDLTQAFPILLATLSPAPTASFNVTELMISGTISYTGKQTGTLKAAAFSDSGMTQQVSNTFTVAWPGSSADYSITGLSGGATYYVGAFIDSANIGTRDTSEAQGAYSSSIAVSMISVAGKHFTLLDPQTNGLPSYWAAQYSAFNGGAGIGAAGDDADHDGYTNLVEYQNGTNPTVADAPNGTGYDPAKDTRPYTISGTVSYNGTQTGTLNVAAYAPADTTFSTPSSTVYQVAWPSGTSKTYTLTVPNGTYVVGAFIDSANIGVRDTSEAQGASAQFTVSGANVGKGVALIDGTSKYQMITAAPVEAKAKAGGPVRFDVNYTTSTLNNKLSGFGIRVHYNSSKLTWAGFTNVFGSPIGDPALVTPVNDDANLDDDPATDRYVVLAWTDVGGNWPNVTLPARLFTANFTAAVGLDVGDTSMIRFTASSTAANYMFVGEPVTFKVIAINLDIDGNGIADALTDGLLIIRYLFEFTGNALINGAVGDGAIRTSAADIEAYLGSAKSSILDIDGNGTVDALTDGLLIIRYLFEFTGNALINGAVGDGAARSTAVDIGNYIEQFKP